MNTPSSLDQLPWCEKVAQLSPSQKKRIKEEYEYPEFRIPFVLHESLSESDVPLIRVNRLLIRPYKPSNTTTSGIYLARRAEAPAILGHVIGFHPSINAYTYPRVLSIGTMVLFHRWADEEVAIVSPKEPTYAAEKLSISIIHIDSVQAILPPLAEMRT